jgi:ATP-dependent helicase IRC3
VSDKVVLRPYQVESLNAIASVFASGKNRILIQKATGTGKTQTFSHLPLHAPITAWLEQFPPRERKMLIIAHREELLDQAAEKIQRTNKDLFVSIEQGARKSSRYSDVVIASVQTLAASGFKRLHRLLDQHVFRIVVVDEAHHAAAPSYRTALVHLGFLPPADASADENADEIEQDAAKLAAHLAGWDAVAPRDRLLVGVTATPNRSDAVGLGCVFQTIAFSYPIRKAVTDGWLVPIKPWVVDTSVSLDGVRTSRGDFNQRELADAVNNAHRNGLAVDAWHKYAHERPTIAFTVDVQHAHDLADAFQQKGIRAAAVSGETPKDVRRQILNDYKRGQIDVLTNCMVLTEGTDLPRASCILHAKPTKSATLYEQMTGRGLRLFEGKAECVVIDMVDIARKHSLQTAPALYGLPPGLISSEGKSLTELAEAWEKFADAHPGLNVEKLGRVAIEQLQVKASTFDVWELPALGAFAAGRAMNWVKTAADTFRVQYPWQDGVEVVAVSPDLLGKFEVVCTFRPKDGPVRQRTLLSGAETAMVAADYAERFISTERGEVSRLTDKGARWRKDPATARQLAALRWRRVNVRPGITKGEAADLLNFARARVGQ